MGEICLFCLNEVQQSIFKNPVPCQCKLVGHPKCFERWFKAKQQIECPICHMIMIQNPLYRQPIVQMVYINVRPIEFQLVRRQKLIVSCVFFVFLVSSVSICIFFLVRSKYKD